MPTLLRTNVKTVWIHKGNQPLGGGNNNILIHADHAEESIAKGFLEEELVHEGAHTSLDPPWMGIVNAVDWRAAQTADGNFISDYARDHPEREDIAESFLPYLAVRYRSARISRPYERTILETMPNRIAYFDRLLQVQSDNAMLPITADLRQSLSFAHFGNGGSITSDLVLVNVKPSATYPAIYFYDQMGALIDPESVVDVTEDLEVREDGALTVRTGIEPLGELVISTHGRGKLVTGSVTVFSDIVRSNLAGRTKTGRTRAARPASAGSCGSTPRPWAWPAWGQVRPETTSFFRRAAKRAESTPEPRSGTWERIRSK